jgi:hypothetical protein
MTCTDCGTTFTSTSVQPAQPSSSSGRPPRPEAASIVLRQYPQEAAAQRAIEALRTARIEGYIATDDLGGLFPPLHAMYPFRLVVSAVHREAAEQLLAEMESAAVALPETGPELVKAQEAPKSLLLVLVAFCLGGILGALVLLGFQQTRARFSGTVQRDFNHDGRTDAWDTYKSGEHIKFAIDYNGDERPDVWYDYENGVMTRWEEDVNFDGKVDLWGNCDSVGRASQSKFDADFDGTAETIGYFQFGRIREQHSVVPASGLVWKKSFFTNGVLREELLDRDRDGKFDERLSLDVYGVEVKKEPLK